MRCWCAMGDSDDREYSAAAYTILNRLWEQLKGLSDFQPGLADLVEFTLVAADNHPEKDATQFLGDAMLLRVFRHKGWGKAV